MTCAEVKDSIVFEKLQVISAGGVECEGDAPAKWPHCVLATCVWEGCRQDKN